LLLLLVLFVVVTDEDDEDECNIIGLVQRVMIENSIEFFSFCCEAVERGKQQKKKKYKNVIFSYFLY
tara:strand:- start:4574 stop:4774 length:201 start_codon:yes stop_codon:yes gene_type:complete